LGFKLTLTTLDDIVERLIFKLFVHIPHHVDSSEQKLVILMLALTQCRAFCYSRDLLDTHRIAILATSTVKNAVLIAN